MCVLSAQRILVGTHCILVGILHSDYIYLLFILLVLGGFFIVFVVLKAVPMSVFLNNFVIILVSAP
jgi:hypothetical protein